MTKILFVCHGNICRSPMAEFVMKDMIRKRGVSDLFEIASAATSREEIGNPVYPPVKKLLESKGISCAGKTAVQIEPADYDYYDYIIGAERANVKNITAMMGGDPKAKIYRLLDFTRNPRDIADPWYTGDFETAYEDVTEGCSALLSIFLSSEIFQTGSFSGGKNPPAEEKSAVSASPAPGINAIPSVSPKPAAEFISLDSMTETGSFAVGENPESEDSGDEEPGADLFRRYLDYKIGAARTSAEEEKLFLDYESIKKKEKTLTSTNGQWNKSACSSTMKWTGCPKINRNSEELPHVIKIKAKKMCSFLKKEKTHLFYFHCSAFRFRQKRDLSAGSRRSFKQFTIIILPASRNSSDLRSD